MIKSVFQKSKLPFIMSIISLLIGLFFLFIGSPIPWHLRLYLWFIQLLPFLIFVLITILWIKFSENFFVKKILKNIIILLIFLLPFYYFLIIFVSAGIEAENPITDLKYYHSIVDDEYLLKAFPDDIPSSAQNISFLYSPSFLQKGEEIFLYYIDSNVDITDFEKKYQNQTLWNGQINEYEDNFNLLDDIFYDLPIETPNDFILYLFDEACDDSGYCNHGKFLITAFNPKTNEILYKYENW